MANFNVDSNAIHQTSGVSSSQGKSSSPTAPLNKTDQKADIAGKSVISRRVSISEWVDTESVPGKKPNFAPNSAQSRRESISEWDDSDSIADAYEPIAGYEGTRDKTLVSSKGKEELSSAHGGDHVLSDSSLTMSSTAIATVANNRDLESEASEVSDDGPAMQELPISDAPKALSAAEPEKSPTSSSIKSKISGLKEKFTTWTQGLKLNRGGELNSAEFSQNLTRLIGASSGNDSKMKGLSNALEKKMAQDPSKAAAVAPKAALLKMGATWNQQGQLTGFKGDVKSMTTAELRGVFQQLDMQKANKENEAIITILRNIPQHGPTVVRYELSQKSDKEFLLTKYAGNKALDDAMMAKTKPPMSFTDFVNSKSDKDVMMQVQIKLGGDVIESKNFWSSTEGQKLVLTDQPDMTAKTDTVEKKPTRTISQDELKQIFSRDEIRQQPSQHEPNRANRDMMAEIDTKRTELGPHFDVGFSDGKLVFPEKTQTGYTTISKQADAVRIIAHLIDDLTSSNDIFMQSGDDPSTSVTLTTLVESLLNSQWANKRFSEETKLDLSKKLGLANLSQAYQRVGKYSFVADLAPAMAKMMPVLDAAGKGDTWHKFADNAQKLAASVEDIDAQAAKVRSAKDLQTANTVADPLSKENKQISENAQKAMMMFADKTPGELIVKGCQDYLNALNTSQNKQQEIMEQVNAHVGQEKWAELNAVLMLL